MAGYKELIKAHTASGSYEIILGDGLLASLDNSSKLLSADRIAVFVSSKVFELHREYIDSFLRNLKNFELIQIEDNEEYKSFKNLEPCLDWMLEKGFTRSSLVLSIGGGVIGDFTGFLASIYMRGIPFIQVPTTLLAMVDASIGGKVAVNLSLGKNIVGSFHQPCAVLSDIRFLKTLPQREFKNGLVEVLKHGVIGDGNTLELLEKNTLQTLYEGDRLIQLIARSVSFKASVVEKDEREKDLRKILNFGHTIGHAIESAFEYQNILHGEAVAIGIYVKLELLKKLNKITAGEFERIASIIDRYELLRKDIVFNTEKIIQHMVYDKKNAFGQVRCIMLNGLGNPETDVVVDADSIRFGFRQFQSKH